MWTVKDCVYEYAKKRGITVTQAESEFKTAVGVIEEACLNGGVSFRGWLTLTRVHRKGRSGKVNGVEYHTDDKYVITATTGAKMSELLNRTVE